MIDSCLLIEPIWNRNAASHCRCVRHGALLIEPIWNRNKGNRKHTCSMARLLIEPIWNRNTNNITVEAVNHMRF